MTTNVILVIELNTNTVDRDHNQSCLRLETAIERQLSQFADVVSLGKSSWCIPLDTSLPFFSAVTGQAIAEKIPFKTAFLNEALDWIKYPPADKA